MKKLIIEVRANEYAARDENPNVPWTADEIARDADAIRTAGASILHFHARKPDGSPDHAYETYAAIIGGIRNVSDLIVHPTLGQITIQGEEARIAHIRQLAEDRLLKPEFASMDIGSTNIDIYDRAAKRFTTTNKTYVNTTETLIYIAKALRKLGVHPVVACWSIPFVRMIEAFFDLDLLPNPAYALLVHTGGGQFGGHPPTPAGLRAFLDVLPRGRPIVWSVSTKPGNLFPTAAQAIQLGGHVAIGIGDDPYTELGTPTNADLVRRVVEMARSYGREVATPDEARRILGITPA
jgi:3-keto-5-aminohexanoate cleavage enzyme